MSRPSVDLGLVPFRDGNMWSVLWGANIQEGISGWGKSPEAAMADFDRVWGASIENGQPAADEVLALRAQLRKADSLIGRAMFGLRRCTAPLRQAYDICSVAAEMADGLADEMEAYSNESREPVPVQECSEVP